MVDTKDIGRSAAACLATNGDEHNGKYYEMNGPEILTGKEMAEILSKVLEKPIKFIELPNDATKHYPPPFAQLLDYMIEKGKDALPFTQDVKNLTGQNGSFEQFVRDHKAEFTG